MTVHILAYGSYQNKMDHIFFKMWEKKKPNKRKFLIRIYKIDNNKKNGYLHQNIINQLQSMREDYKNVLQTYSGQIVQYILECLIIKMCVFIKLYDIIRYYRNIIIERKNFLSISEVYKKNFISIPDVYCLK